MAYTLVLTYLYSTFTFSVVINDTIQSPAFTCKKKKSSAYKYCPQTHILEEKSG